MLAEDGTLDDFNVSDIEGSSHTHNLWIILCFYQGAQWKCIHPRESIFTIRSSFLVSKVRLVNNFEDIATLDEEYILPHHVPRIIPEN